MFGKQVTLLLHPSACGIYLPGPTTKFPKYLSFEYLFEIRSLTSTITLPDGNHILFVSSIIFLNGISLQTEYPIIRMDCPFLAPMRDNNLVVGPLIYYF